MFVEPMKELFSRSQPITLDFQKITADTPLTQNIEAYFKDQLVQSRNPRRPENRQAFNNQALATSGARYLVGMYGEDRVAMLSDTPAGREGRTIHMAVDIFAKELEPVFAPASGEIVRSGYEEGFGEFGNYVILQPQGASYYMFFGHLASDRLPAGLVKQGQVIAHLGDYKNNENGGWSRHLHLQILTELPPQGKAPIGYSTAKDFEANAKLFPNPFDYFPDWHILDTCAKLKSRLD